MRVAILTDNTNSFKKPTGYGLQRMLDQLGVESKVFLDGIRMLSPYGGYMPFLPRKEQKWRKLLLDWVNRKIPCLLNLHSYDIIVVVYNLPRIFTRDYLPNIETLIRNIYPEKIVVAYSNYYLLTREYWLEWLKNGNPCVGVNRGGNFGLERYDWYFCASVVSEYPLPRIHNPYSLLGLNLDDGSLYPAKKDRFIALIDFERPRKRQRKERALQLRALEETNTEYIILETTGSYSLEEIRRIYRQCSMFLVAHRENFGVSLCEAQACGNYIFTPYSNWCPGHWIKDDLYAPGEGKLSPNFVVYDNDLETLKQQINRIKRIYDSEEVFNTFTTYHPYFLYGDINELQEFLRKVERREITGQSHLEYEELQQAWYSLYPERETPGIWAMAIGWNRDEENNIAAQLEPECLPSQPTRKLLSRYA